MATFHKELIAQVSVKNQQWVASLTVKELAKILDTIAIIPYMKEHKIIQDEPQDIAVNKGIKGENKFEHIVNQFLSNDYKLENVAKQGKAGDFMLKWRSYKTNKTYKIIIDVKNYKNTVPCKEVEKFYRDANINHVDGGFLISLHSKIVGVSKMIEFKEFMSDRGKLPMLFVSSSTPELIAEVIKMLFHMIEIRDTCSNSNVSKLTELALRTNELDESIQIIAQCRETLQVAKHTIEKNLNQIMIQLISCEYGLVNKIKQINATIMNDDHLEHIVEVESEIENQTINDDEPHKVVKIIIDMFSNTITETDEAILYQLYQTQETWDHSSINIPKRMWQLIHNENQVNIRFMKTGMVAIFPVILDNMLEVISDMRKAKKIRNSSDGIIIKFDTDNIAQIMELCQFM